MAAWGFQVDGEGKVTLLPTKFMGSPGPELQDAIFSWDRQALGEAKLRTDPRQALLGPLVQLGTR